jgi:hypothetical protein
VSIVSNTSRVGVGSWSIIGVLVEVAVGVFVGDGVGVWVNVADAVAVGVLVADGVADAVTVGVGVLVADGDAVGMCVADAVTVGTGASVAGTGTLVEHATSSRNADRRMPIVIVLYLIFPPALLTIATSYPVLRRAFLSRQMPY